MAVAYQSIASTAWAAATSVVVSKPTGLAVGDVMIAIIAFVDGGSETITEPSGWTLEETVDITGEMRLDVWQKVATSADVAASNFTWALGNERHIAGAILRVDGQNSTLPVWQSNAATTNNTATPSFSNSITSLPANSLLIMVVLGYDTVGGALSTYAIVTSNPTWTERVELLTSNSNGYSLGIATASRPQSTATGNSSAAGGDSTSDWACILLAISENKDITIAETLTMTDTVKNDITIELSETLTMTDTVIAELGKQWRNVTKHVSDWINEDKTL